MTRAEDRQSVSIDGWLLITQHLKSVVFVAIHLQPKNEFRYAVVLQVNYCKLRHSYVNTVVFTDSLV